MCQFHSFLSPFNFFSIQTKKCKGIFFVFHNFSIHSFDSNDHFDYIYLTENINGVNQIKQKKIAFFANDKSKAEIIDNKQQIDSLIVYFQVELAQMEQYIKANRKKYKKEYEEKFNLKM